jgi:hypothetical protein
MVPLFLLAGCMHSIGALHPQPNIDLEPGGTPLSLAIDESVPDDFTQYRQQTRRNSTAGFDVSGWRATLGEAFAASLAPHDPPAPGAPPPRVVRLVAADLYITAGWGAAIRYRLRLEEQGAVVCRDADTALSKPPPSGEADVAGYSVASAVESMFEQFARACLAGPER